VLHNKLNAAKIKLNADRLKIVDLEREVKELKRENAVLRLQLKHPLKPHVVTMETA
jgi:hypothetical protein